MQCNLTNFGANPITALEIFKVFYSFRKHNFRVIDEYFRERKIFNDVKIHQSLKIN